jgi:hypothetical protein
VGTQKQSESKGRKGKTGKAKNIRKHQTLDTDIDEID